MAVSTVSRPRPESSPAKPKLKVVTVALSGTYTSEGEVLTAAKLGFRRIVSATASLTGSNATEATPVEQLLHHRSNPAGPKSNSGCSTGKPGPSLPRV
jgi:hypothetical protein